MCDNDYETKQFVPPSKSQAEVEPVFDINDAANQSTSLSVAISHHEEQAMSIMAEFDELDAWPTHARIENL